MAAPTPSQIQLELAAAQAADLDWADMALLLKRAIINAIFNSAGEVQLPWTATGSDGTTISRVTLQEATALYAKFSALATGGIVSQFAEFRDVASDRLL